MIKKYLTIIVACILLAGCSNNNESSVESNVINASTYESNYDPTIHSTEENVPETTDINDTDNFYVTLLKEDGTIVGEKTAEDGSYMLIINKGNKEGQLYYQFPDEPVRDSIIRILDTVGLLQTEEFSNFDKLTMEWAKFDSDFPIAVFTPTRDSNGEWTAILPISWLDSDYGTEYEKMIEEFNAAQSN